MSKDLVALVADVQQEKTLETLLRERRQSLRMRAITFDIFRHPRKDAGVYHEAADFLAPYRPPQYDHALVMLDCAWDGAPGSATHLRQAIGQGLQARGWQVGAYEVIAIEPELEVWVWATSPAAPDVLRVTWDDIRALARQRSYWVEGDAKPVQPKELLEAILRQQRRPRSASIFQGLARRVGLAQCQDPSFVLLRDTLALWFAAR